MGRGDHMAAVKLADALCSGSACVDSSLDSAHVAADHNGDQTGADLLLADEMNVSRLYHGVGCFDGADEAAGLDHSQC